MFKRPARIWFLYATTLAIFLPAMVMVTIHALEVDRARNDLLQQKEAERREAQVQDLVTAALWRLDAAVTPLVGPETTRPYLVYEPFFHCVSPTKSASSVAFQVNTGEKGASNWMQPSPLLQTPSRYVTLHFQVGPDEQWSSPQAPAPRYAQLVEACQIPTQRVDVSSNLLSLLRQKLSFDRLAERLPKEANSNWLSNVSPIANNRINDDATIVLAAKNGADFDNSGLNRLRNYQTMVGGSGINQAGEVLPQFDQAEENAGYQAPQQQMESQAAGAQQATLSGPYNFQQDAQAPPNSVPQQMAATDNLQRADKDWIRRHQAYQTYADSSYQQQQLYLENTSKVSSLVQTGVARWIWWNDELMLLRRVSVDGQPIIQGCWINWDELKSTLLAEIQDLLPMANLVSIKSDEETLPARSLATLPVALTLPENAIDDLELAELLPLTQPHRVSPIRVTLQIAWAGFLIAVLAMGLLLFGVIQLSERRAAFVSAVTHELRTPLTTFRIYAEMLANEMVPKPERRREYLETLQREADRLTRLVENVLAYSRLERGRPMARPETLTVGELIDRCQTRLVDRANEAEMKLQVEVEAADRKELIRTDPSVVDQILFNLVDNACKYARSSDKCEIDLHVSSTRHGWYFFVRDYGPGIEAPERKRLFQPFSKSVERAAETAPGVGLGLALCRRLASALGGELQARQPHGGPGAAFELRLPRDIKHDAPTSN